MLKLPKSWTASSSTPKKITANQHIDGLDMSANSVDKGICPVSGKPMVKMYANGHLAWVSLDQRIVLPIKD